MSGVLVGLEATVLCKGTAWVQSKTELGRKPPEATEWVNWTPALQIKRARNKKS